MTAKRLDELLLTEGLIDEQSMSIVRTEALARQRKLAEIVIDLGLVDQRTLAGLLAKELDAELVSPIDIAAVREVARVIPPHLARRHQVVPVRSDEGRLVVAMIDPFEPGITELLESATGTPVRRAVGVRSEIEMALLDLYGDDDAANATLMAPRGLALDLHSADDAPAAAADYSGIPDDWSTSPGTVPLPEEFATPGLPASSPDADSTAPSTAGKVSDSERIAHVERQLLTVARALALIQSRLDTIDARLANLAGQQKASR